MSHCFFWEAKNNYYTEADFGLLKLALLNLHFLNFVIYTGNKIWLAQPLVHTKTRKTSSDIICFELLFGNLNFSVFGIWVSFLLIHNQFNKHVQWDKD